MSVGTLILFLFGILILLAIILQFLKPKIKGKYGEVKVSLRLSHLNSIKYKVINDVLITHNGRSSQIDHLVISNYGIFIIETKNYKGWIFGHESAEEWTQTLYNNKYKLRNPIIQNWGHIQTLKTVLSEFPFVPYFPIIVFAGEAKLIYIQSKVPVITSNKLIHCISESSTTEYLSNEEVDQIYQKIVRLNSTESASRKSHIKRAITAKQNNWVSKTCPRCDGRLILKDGKYGRFYGCSKFPNCTYTKEYK